MATFVLSVCWITTETGLENQLNALSLQGYTLVDFDYKPAKDQELLTPH